MKQNRGLRLAFIMLKARSVTSTMRNPTNKYWVNKGGLSVTRGRGLAEGLAEGPATRRLDKRWKNGCLD